MIALALALLTPIDRTRTIQYEPLQIIQKRESLLEYIVPKFDVIKPIYTPNTYAAGNCTWYVKSLRPELPDNLGNADTWYYRAEQQGYSVGSTPRVGSIAAARYYMHVAVVTAVQGNTITVSEMNYKGYGIVSNRTTPISEWEYIY